MNIIRICQRVGILAVLLAALGSFILGVPLEIVADTVREGPYTNQPQVVTPTVIFPNNLHAEIQVWTPTEIVANVPIGTTSGEVAVQSGTGNSNIVPYTVGNSTVPDGSGEGTSWSTIFSGVINTNTVWAQNILLTGDVTINSGAELVIEPGVTVFFVANSDDQASGLWADKVELHAYGTLTANGTEANPIYFTSDASSKGPGDWGSIIIDKDSFMSSLEYSVIHYALYGVHFRGFRFGAGLVSGTVHHCFISNTERGVNILGRPGYPLGGTLNINPSISSNYVVSNTFGIYSSSVGGYGNILNTTLIQDNVIVSNDTGVFIGAESWWFGHIDDYPMITNNTIRDNQQYGVHIKASGSDDGSGSDTDLKPSIQNNLLNNNGTNIYLELEPTGSDGVQILEPVIRYNTIRNATTGILIEDTEPYDTLEPTIAYNIFTDISGYAIDNTTNRNIVAENNYWGGDVDEWDAGPQASDVNGNVTTGNHLTSASPPMVSRLSPGTAAFGETVQLHGANFGTSYADVFINKSVSHSTALPGQPIIYTLTFGNNGPDIASNTVITDVLPTFIQNPQFVSSGTFITQTSSIPLAWQTGDMAPGTGGIITITGVISPELTTETTLVNSIEITNTQDMTPTNNVDTAETQIIVPEISFSQANYTVDEGAGAITVTAVLSPVQPFMDVFVDYYTVNGTAVAGEDYTTASNTLVFPQGITETTFTIPILDDDIEEPNENFLLNLVNPVHAQIQFSPISITIIDDDVSFEESYIYLPVVVRPPAEPEITFPVFIGEPIPMRPVSSQGEVFYTTEVQIPEIIPVGGQFFLSADSDLLQEVVVDDEIVFLLDGAEIFVYTFSDGSTSPQPANVEIPRAVIQAMAGQEVTVMYRDVYGAVVNASEIWIQHVP